MPYFTPHTNVNPMNRPNTCFLNIAFLFLLGIVLTLPALAQNAGVTGRLTDVQGAPVPFANVSLLKEDKKLVAGVLTDSAGKYVLQPPAAGRYQLRFSGIGWQEGSTPVFDWGGPGSVPDFGATVLLQDSKTLRDVSVMSLRPLIIQKPDRMIVNVEGTVMAAGNNVFNVLARAPGVFIDPDGNIQLNGRSGVTVMLDGKLTYLSARDLRNLLEGMSAENLKSIEIITNPGSKYDAEGTSGILNIVLKRNARQGMNGSINAGYTYNFKQHAYSYGGSVNYKKGDWNSFASVDGARRVGGREATFTRIFYSPSKTTYFDQVATGNFEVEGPPSVRIGTDYTINGKHSIGFVANINSNTAHSDFLTDTYIGTTPHDRDQYIDADNFNSNTFTSYTGNLHYTLKLDTVGTQLSADLDGARISNRGDGHFNNRYKNLTNGVETQDLLYTYTPNGYDIVSGKVDFSRPLRHGQTMEAGAKASRVVSDNDFRFYFNNGSLVPDPQRTNHFYYEESIYAGYLNWNGSLSKKLTFQSGLRAEQTLSTGHSFTTGTVTHRSYLDFFPSIFLQQKVSDNYGLTYSYSRRLSRPGYGSLNPFRSYRDPYTYTEGNPYLRPQYTHQFSVAQTIRRIYNITVSYQYMIDVMAEIPLLDVANAVTVYTTGNVDDGQSLSLTGIAPLRITKWWDTQNTGLLFYNKFSMRSAAGKVDNDQVSYTIQSNHTLSLPKSFRVEVSFLYRSARASGLYHMAATSRVDAGFRKSIARKKIDVSVNATDIFKGFRYLWSTRINGNVNDFDQYFRWRTIGVSLRYNFSKGQKVELKRRNNSLEELNRT
jgi:hypothetical protein